MNSGKTIFAQLMDFIPSAYEFRCCVERYHGHYKVKSFSCWDQFLTLAFAQLTYRESLRDIEACLRATPQKLYHMGLRSSVSPTPWPTPIRFANLRRLCSYPHPRGTQPLGGGTLWYRTQPDHLRARCNHHRPMPIIFPWAQFRRHKSAVKLHTLLDLRGSIPTVAIVTGGQIHEVNILDQLIWEAGAIYLMDRAYLDFRRLYRMHQSGAFFVTRAK